MRLLVRTVAQSLVVAVFVVAVFMAMIWLVGAVPSVRPTPAPVNKSRWEYHVLDTGIGKPFPFAKDLNDLGEDGWELAGTPVDNGSTVSFIFKRPK